MSAEIRQSELRNDTAAIMRRVAEGESFVVTVNGRPVADVIPHRHGAGRRRFVPAAEAIAALNAAPLSGGDVRRWWHDIRDGGVDTPQDPWQ
jgi:prevent-host-death family protein